MLHFICKKPGHWKNECPNKDKKEVASSSVTVESGDGEVDENVLTAVATGVSSNEWVIDSGASYHMTPYRDCFSSFEVKEGNEIAMGNGAICKSMGSGSVQIRMFDGVVRTLTNVRYVLGLRKSLISFGATGFSRMQDHYREGLLEDFEAGTCGYERC